MAIRFNASICGCGKETIVNSFAETLDHEKNHFIQPCGICFII